MKKLLQFAIVTCLAMNQLAIAAEMDEYRVKALFLYNFTQFIEWPADVFKDASEALTICILGPNPFDRELDHALLGKRVDGHSLISRLITEAAQSPGCQIVFVTNGATKRSRNLMSDRKLQVGVLTVGEAPGFAANGGVVNFLVKDGRVKLEINIAAAERQHLRISAKLLKLADIVSK